MSSQLAQLLAAWYPRRDDAGWVLGTVYRTEGSTYRKAGAMMLVNDQQEQYGLLSGGCLESDIMQHAARIMQDGKPGTLCYDAGDESNIAFELGIGCGGVVHILLQPITAQHDYLSLDAVHLALQQRQSGTYYQRIPATDHVIATRFEPSDTTAQAQTKAMLIQQDGADWLATPVQPPPHLFIAGAGLDAIPLIELARAMGWHISLWDPRVEDPAIMQQYDCDRFVTCKAAALGEYATANKVDAAVLMTHSIALDAVGLSQLQQGPLRYLAMIGPPQRRAQILEEAGLSEDTLQLPLASPAGFDLGTSQPESIALSVLAECQAVLNNTSGKSLSGIVAP